MWGKQCNRGTVQADSQGKKQTNADTCILIGLWTEFQECLDQFESMSLAKSQ